MIGPSMCRQQEKEIHVQDLQLLAPSFLLSSLRKQRHVSSFARVLCAVADRYRSKNSDGQS